MFTDIVYAPYSRVYHGSMATILEIRRGATVWAADFGDIELDAKGHYEDGLLVVDYCISGWSNDGPALDWEYFAFTEGDEASMQYWLEPEDDAAREAWRLAPVQNHPGYSKWEHIHGEDAEERIQFWQSHLPAQGKITIDLTGEEPVASVEYYDKETPND